MWTEPGCFVVVFVVKDRLLKFDDTCGFEHELLSGNV